MASYVDMSLEDIIKKKKLNTRLNNMGKPKQMIPPKPFITDARNNIIFKKRTQIKDARDKLAELSKHKDARIKLNQLREKKIGVKKSMGRIYDIHNAPEFHGGKRMRTIANKEIVFTDHTRQVRSQPQQANLRAKLQSNRKQFMEGRSFGTRHHEPNRRLKPIVRTVENDIVIIDDDDPMGEEYYPSRITSMNQKASFNLKIIAHNNDTHLKPSINNRRNAPEKERSPQRLPSILKKRPMASLRSERKEIIEETPPEYRIIVSNLKSSVSSGDIQELFGDVGALVESRLVRPGTAEVIYKSQEDAQRAVDLYHNRQLDGQAMNCLLVIPRSNAPHASRSSSSGNKPSLPPSTSSNVEPDLSTFHKVLFSNF